MTAVAVKHRVFQAFGGARCEIFAAEGTDEDITEVVEEVVAFERRLTRFDPSSELNQFNAHAGEWFAPSPLLHALLTAALDAHDRSGGLVNAAVHDAVVQGGYDRTFGSVRVTAAGTVSVPVPALPDVLDVDPRRARLAPGWRIDLGGIGKGWLADRLAERFDNAVVNLGGDVRALGAGTDGAGWRIGLCDGRTVTVLDRGVATTGAGRHGQHVIDPRTGLPARTDVDVVSVVAATAFDAEVGAKVAFLRGRAWALTHPEVVMAA